MGSSTMRWCDGEPVLGRSLERFLQGSAPWRGATSLDCALGYA